MRSVALTNYDGNASLNAIQPVGSPFTLTLRCDHHATTSGDVEGDDDDAADADADDVIITLGCGDIVNASITTFGYTAAGRATTLPLTLRKTEHGGSHTLLSVTVPAGTIAAELGVIVFSAAGEVEYRAEAALARKALERLRIASRSRGLDREHYAGTIAQVRETLPSMFSFLRFSCYSSRCPEPVPPKPSCSDSLCDHSSEVAVFCCCRRAIRCGSHRPRR
jgi:hypothetical protein